MQQGTIVTSEVHCKTLKNLHKAIQNKRHVMLTFGVLLHHDNVCQHKTACTQALLEHFN
jgi:hypothetical protein